MTDVTILQKGDWELVKELSKGRYPIDLLKKSFDWFVKHKLRYNSKSGKEYVGKEMVSEFSYKQDIPSDYSREDIIEWMFMPHINDGTQRLKHGHKVSGG